MCFMKRTAIVITGLIAAITMTVSDSIPSVHAEESVKHVLYMEGKQANETDMFIQNGQMFVSLKQLAAAFGLPLTYSLTDELFTYHDYKLAAGDHTVLVWGNSYRGYQINIRAAGEESWENDAVVYKPELNCQPESDYCEVIKEKYRGPVARDGRLYVPIRMIAKALDLTMDVQKKNNQFFVDLVKR
ncbi:hypothetical protein M3650_14195 [Paenibacillus sp. MER TA 81-3]|uniref:hypothetical protein n=1 Tax=Paenibacillus sp. MER TA 81-3 TaxID=2939573 RepID=UPI0020404BDC|nr:hypothetical protein [Paenibacillus sp. MER TA 81-3]MCM3339747.1 hypothetical protein [Paenibacillus sp. MER TA 81-3]